MQYSVRKGLRMMMAVEVKFVNNIPTRLKMFRKEYEKIVELKKVRAIDYPTDNSMYNVDTLRAKVLKTIENNFVLMLKEMDIYDLVEHICPILKVKDMIEYIEVGIKWKEEPKRKEFIEWKPKI